MVVASHSGSTAAQAGSTLVFRLTHWRLPVCRCIPVAAGAVHGGHPLIRACRWDPSESKGQGLDLARKGHELVIAHRTTADELFGDFQLTQRILKCHGPVAEMTP